MVKYLIPSLPRIMQHYSKDSYVFLSNFTRIVLYYAEGFKESLTKTNQTTGQATPQVNKFDELLEYCQEPRSTKEMMVFLKLKHRESFRDNWLLPLLEAGELKMTLPDKPKSPNQRYRSTKTCL